MKDAEVSFLSGPASLWRIWIWLVTVLKKHCPTPIHLRISQSINANFTLQLRCMSKSLTLLSPTSPFDHSENSTVFIYFLIGRVFIQYTLIIQNNEFYVAFVYTSKNISYFICLCLPMTPIFSLAPCFPSLQFLLTLPLLFACHF